MTETPENKESEGARRAASTDLTAVKEWFTREILPLEAILMRFLRQNLRDKADIADLRQEVYVRVYEAARKQIPDLAKTFVLITARNLLVDRIRRERIIPIETVTDLEAMGVASDEAGPDRAAMARDALRRLQAALDQLPPQCREVVLLRKVEGLSRQETALRLGVTERTVNRHIVQAMRALADVLYSEEPDLRLKP
jgi:RNA polymerase sigma factor (sigma-70 family)